MKIICLPFAGGNKYSYTKLKPLLNRGIDFVTLELPGRGTRSTELLESNMDLLVQDLHRQIQPHLSSDYMIYGHSMGGILGNLLIQRLNRNKENLPLFFLVTGCGAPSKRHLKRTIHDLSDTHFQQELKQLGGMPDEVLKSRELLEYVLPIVRNDIKAIETHQYQKAAKYTVPITIITGTEEGLSGQDIASWQEETTYNLRFFRLTGGHFFIYKHYAKIAKIINNVLKESVLLVA